MRRLLVFTSLLAALALPAPPAAGAINWIVDDTADPFPITGTLTLRQALLNANTMPGTQHHVLFQLPGAGIQTIALQSELPVITVDSVWIDGWSQPGASPGSAPPGTAILQVELDGMLAGYAHGLIVASSFNLIEGLSIMNFQRDGIRVQGSPLPGTRSNRVYGNWVGIDASGAFASGNGTNPAGGIWAGVDVICPPGPLVYCTGTRVERNLISRNLRCGVQISSCPPSDCWANQVLFNWIGTDFTGMLGAGNLGTGVVLAEGTHDNVIASNVISSNGANGVDLTGNDMTMPPTYTDRNQFVNNLIGVAADGVTPMGNGGRGASVGIFEINSFLGGYCRFNRFQTNTIAHNAMSGITVWEKPTTPNNADQNTLFRNALHDNGGLGIDLGDNGVTGNDPGDVDAGANEELNTPLIMTANYLGGVTTLAGTVDLAGPNTEVHLYKAKLDPSGFGEGERWLALTRPDALGNWTANLNLVFPGDHVTALTMDWAGGATSNTSEFSPNVMVVNLGDVAGDPAGRAVFGMAVRGPNPFRARTSLACGLPRAGMARLCIYDLSGKLVRTLLSGPLEAGERVVTWDGADAAGRAVAPGIYFAEWTAAAQRATRRIVRLQ